MLQLHFMRRTHQVHSRTGAGDELLDCNKLQACIQDLNAMHTMGASLHLDSRFDPCLCAITWPDSPLTI